MEKDTIARKADFLYQCEPANPVSPPQIYIADDAMSHCMTPGSLTTTEQRHEE